MTRLIAWRGEDRAGLQEGQVRGAQRALVVLVTAKHPSRCPKGIL